MSFLTSPAPSRSRSLGASLLPLALVLTAAPGCAAMMKGMTPTPRTAENPLLGGQPLEASKKASLGVITEDDCTMWPFEDAIQVTVTEAQICVATHKHVEQPPGWTGEPTANRSELVSVRNDAGEGGSISIEKVRSAKIASCFNRGYNEQINIYAFDYEGCAPNNGTVTAATRSLQVGSESWSFAGAGSGGDPADTPTATVTTTSRPPG